MYTHKQHVPREAVTQTGRSCPDPDGQKTLAAIIERAASVGAVEFGDAMAATLARSLCQRLVFLKLDRDPDFAQAAVRLIAASDQFHAWRLHVLTLARRMEAAERSAPSGRGHPTVALVLDLIDRRYHESGLCLKVAAAIVRCSSSHLGELLRRETGLGFTAHLRRRRVSAATRMLRESTLPLKAIAIESGFPTACQFSRQFARAVGTTPTRYRRLAAIRQDAAELASEGPCETSRALHNR